jgi:hypothetical protein
VRSFISFLFAVLAVVSAAVASMASWVWRHIVSSDGFSALATPLISDPEIKSQLTSTASSQATDTIVSTVPLLSGLRDRIDSAIRGALDVVANQEKYGPAAHESLMSIHDSAFSAEHSASISLKPLTRLLMESVTQPLGIATPEGSSAVIPLGAPSAFGYNLFAVMQQMGALWPVFLVAAAVLAVLAVGAARRRWLALAGMGVGLILAGWMERGMAGGLPDRAAGSIPEAVGALFARKVAEQAVPSMQAEAMWLVYAGAALLVMALVVGLSANERRHRYVTA